MKTPVFDIIIVTYNAKNTLQRLLRSIDAHTKNLKYTLTVVDNNSRDGTRKFLEKYGRAMTVVKNKKNVGFSRAANRALKNTRHPFVVLLDDDVEVTAGWLEDLYRVMRTKKNGGIVSGKIVFPDNRIFCAGYSVRRQMDIGRDEIDAGQRDYVAECDAISGPCWLVRRQVFKDVGYFDERFFPCQSEDIDYCVRARLAGYKIIYNGLVKIIHHHLYRDMGKSRINKNRFLKKWKDVLNRFPLKDSALEAKLIENGVEFLNKKEYNRALSRFKRARSIRTAFVEPFYTGRAFYAAGFYRESIKEYEKTLSLYPEGHRHTQEANRFLSLAYTKIGSPEKAVAKVADYIRSRAGNNDESKIHNF